MNFIEIIVQGLESLLRSFSNVIDKIGDRNDNPVARDAYIIERQMKENWGHGTHQGGFPNVRTGRLRASIHTTIISSTQAVVGTNVFYAPFVEFGHRQHPGQYVPPIHRRLVANFSPAYPFMFPVIDQTQDQIKDAEVSFCQTLGAEWSRS